MPPQASSDEVDRRFMAAAIRLSRRNLGLTGTNPSVGTLIVRDDGNGPVIVGRGVTAIGGRPHAEPQALADAGDLAKGATAYVTLEPCAHHGRTPPCANALVTSGVARVVGAANDPDDRVSGRGYAILREAGIEVVEGVLAAQAADMMRGYLTRSVRKRPEVILKLAVSADGKIGRRGQGQVAITGEIARRQVHLLRAESDAILIGSGTAKADDPSLSCRLTGLENRSPIRIVLDRQARLDPASQLAKTAKDIPVIVAAGPDADLQQRDALAALGVTFQCAEIYQDRIALPELLEDLAGQGVMTLMVEGGAETAASFLDEGLVDRIALFTAPHEIGTDGISSPIDDERIRQGFALIREAQFGDDRYREYVRAG